MEWNIIGSRMKKVKTTNKRKGTDLYKQWNRVWWNYSEYLSRNIFSRKELVQRRNLKVLKSLEDRRRKKWHKFLCLAQSSKKEKKKMYLLSNFIGKALIESTRKLSNVSKNRRKKLRSRTMVFLQPGMHLTKEFSGN